MYTLLDIFINFNNDPLVRDFLSYSSDTSIHKLVRNFENLKPRPIDYNMIKRNNIDLKIV